MSSAGNLRDIPRRRPHRDPAGKAALFSSAAPRTPAAGRGSTPVPTEPADAAPAPTPASPAATEGVHGFGTLVVECGDCKRSTRVTWMDFALLNLPLSLWLPLPGLRFNHRMTCPACHRRAWVRARWAA